MQLLYGTACMPILKLYSHRSGMMGHEAIWHPCSLYVNSSRYYCNILCDSFIIIIHALGFKLLSSLQYDGQSAYVWCTLIMDFDRMYFKAVEIYCTTLINGKNYTISEDS